MPADESRALQDACERILHRLQQRRDASLPCFLCGLSITGGEESLAGHLLRSHAVEVQPFSDVVDCDGFIDCLRTRMGVADSVTPSESVCCPVCQSPVGAMAALPAHVREAGHTAWNKSTIPGLAAYCLPMQASGTAATAGSSGKEEEDSDSEGSQGRRHAGRNDVDEDGREEELLGSDDDWNDACVCLFCDVESEDCLGHMRAVHGFDLPATTTARADVTNEYDIIRLINAVRRCVMAGTCPFHYGSADTSACALAGTTLEEHLREHPDHRLPRAVPQRGDDDLIPVLPGDALLSLVVTSGEGFLRDEEPEPDFPMAPTLQEVAAYGAALDRQETARQSRNSK